MPQQDATPLGAHLKRFRDDSRYSLESVERDTGISYEHVMKLEFDQERPTSQEAIALLKLYRASDQEIDAVLKVLRAADSRAEDQLAKTSALALIDESSPKRGDLQVPRSRRAALAEILRCVRIRVNIPAREVERRTGIPTEVVLDWENVNGTSLPALQELREIVTALGAYDRLEEMSDLLADARRSTSRGITFSDSPSPNQVANFAQAPNPSAQVQAIATGTEVVPLRKVATPTPLQHTNETRPERASETSSPRTVETSPQTRETSVFISYRRSDQQETAHKIYDFLSLLLGRNSTFIDIDSIRAGQPFAKALTTWLNKCTSMVVVIGRDWISVADPAGQRRLDDLDDFVRMEVACGLDRGIKIIPVLMYGAAMPSVSELPPSLQALSSIQALTILNESDFEIKIWKLYDLVRGAPAERGQ